MKKKLEILFVSSLPHSPFPLSPRTFEQAPFSTSAATRVAVKIFYDAELCVWHAKGASLTLQNLEGDEALQVFCIWSVFATYVHVYAKGRREHIEALVPRLLGKVADKVYVGTYHEAVVLRLEHSESGRNERPCFATSILGNNAKN